MRRAETFLERTDWHAIALLCEGLVAMARAAGAMGTRGSIDNVSGGPAGLIALAQQNQEEMIAFRPNWATKAHLLARAKLNGDAVRQWLAEQLSALDN